MKKYWLLMIVSTLVLILSACTSDSDVDPESADADDESATSGASGDITISTPSDVISLNPQGSNDSASEVVRNVIYEGLVEFDAEGELIPVLATDYEQLDELTWEFNLREDVTFHDGSDFNAEAVKSNLDRINDPLVGSERAYLLEMIEKVEVIDDHTVHIKTEYPFTPLDMNLGHGGGKLLSKELIDEDYENAITEAGLDISLEEYYQARDESDEEALESAEAISESIGAVIEQNPAGTGYMQFDSRSPGEQTVIVKNPDYWNGEPSLDSVTYKVVPESGARIAELETGTTEVTDGVNTDNIARLEETEGINLHMVESNQIDYVGMNTESEPLDDVEVRQALSYALDREEIIEGIFNGSGRPGYGPIAPGMMGYTDDVNQYEYDIERAQELLEEAGHGDGLDLTIAVNDDNEERVDIAVYLQETLAEIGVNLEIQQLEWGTFLEATGNGEYDLFVSGWVNTTGSSDNAIYPLYHTDNMGLNGNRSFFSNEELDALIDEARSETDADARAEIYTEAQQLIAEEAPVIFVRYGDNLAASIDGVNDVVLTKNGLYDFSETTVE